MVNKKSRLKCQAISKYSGKQCEKYRLKWSHYCWWHQPKRLALLSLFTGAILGYFVNYFGNIIIPPKSEKRRDEVVLRIAADAASVIWYSDFCLMTYLGSLDDKNLWEELNSYKIYDASNYFNTEIDSLLETAFSNKKMLEWSHSYNEKNQKLAWISRFKWSFTKTQVASADFLIRYGSVDHPIITTISKLNSRVETLLWWLENLFKNPEILQNWYSNNHTDQLSDFLSGYYLYQYECKTLISQIKPDLYVNEKNMIKGMLSTKDSNQKTDQDL